MGIIKSLIFSTSLLLTTLGFASVTNVTISGASLFNTVPGTEAWGVLVGVYLNDAAPGPYDNCRFSLDDDPVNNTTGTASTFEGCHPARVNGDTVITITFTETEAVTNKKAVVYVKPDLSGNVIPEGDVLNRSLNTVSGTNLSFTLTFTWADLCRRIAVDGAGTKATFDDATQTCKNGAGRVNGSLNLEFGVEDTLLKTPVSSTITFHVYSPEPELGLMDPPTPGCAAALAPDFGFCDVSIFPGDQGGFLIADISGTHENQSFASTTSFTSFIKRDGTSDNATLDVEKIRVYVSPNSCIDAQPNVTSTKVIERTVKSISGGVAAFENSDFSGLINGTPYFVRAATVDSSGTVSQLFSEDYCPNFFTFTPSKVAGLIEENSCFITTATYGSDQAHQVNLFRLFRKKILFASSLGHKIILLYNTYGPLGAKWINRHPNSRGFIRALLYPFYGFAYLSVHYGLASALTIYTIFTLLILGFIRFVFLKTEAKA